MYKKKISFLVVFIWLLLAIGVQAQQPCPLTVNVAPPALLTCQNPSVQLNTTVTPPGGNYFVNWAGPQQLPNVLNPVVNTPGTYVVFVFDSIQCFGSDTIVVASDGSLPSLAITEDFTPCEYPNTPVTLTATAAGPGQYTFSWTGGGTGNTLDVTVNGTYCVTATDQTSGCTAAACYVVNQPSPPSVGIFYYDGIFCGDSTVMFANIAGGVPPFSYTWNDGSTSGGLFDPLPGTYVVTVTDAFGCTAAASQVVEEDPNECAHIAGDVLADWNMNCVQDGPDEGLANVTIRIKNAQNNLFYAYTDADGHFDFELFPGTYEIDVLAPSTLWQPCQGTLTLTVNANQTVQQDFLLKPLALCPALTVDIGNPFLRRCFNGSYSVYYFNSGTQEANNAYIEMTFDPFLSLTGATIPYTSLGNNQFRFDVGTVAYNGWGYFTVQVMVSCNATLGQTHCTEAIIYPTGNCEPPSAQWSGASLQISANCQNDSLDFVIQNIGTGAMIDPLEYVVIEDAVMLMQAPPPAILLAPGASHHVKVPANGSTWRVEAEQVAFHPGNSMPSLSVEGCTTGGQFSTGFVNQFPADDNDPWVDIDCTSNVGAYDPNDKQGFPTGYESAHYIEPGTDIEYLIRFQNTGTDTAFTVVIRDELSAWLDPGTIVPGASSHPYRFDFYGDRNIKFSFENINLPDSSKSQEASQGFVSFRIAQKAGIPLETNILNRAGIFFDFNEPVYTNTTVHRVGRDFVTVGAWQPVRPGLDLRILPNPVAESAILQLDGLTPGAGWTAELNDATGRTVRQAQLNDTQWHFQREGLPAGIYFLRVVSAGQVLGTGKVMLK